MIATSSVAAIVHVRSQGGGRGSFHYIEKLQRELLLYSTFPPGSRYYIVIFPEVHLPYDTGTALAGNDQRELLQVRAFRFGTASCGVQNDEIGEWVGNAVVGVRQVDGPFLPRPGVIQAEELV